MMAQIAKKQKQPAPVVETITGTISRRIFYNSENGYCVLAVRSGVRIDEIEQEYKLSGHMASIREGDEYRFTGQWTNHPKYGNQFKFESAELIIPTGAAGLAKY